jgi:hypothetical protein
MDKIHFKLRTIASKETKHIETTSKPLQYRTAPSGTDKSCCLPRLASQIKTRNGQAWAWVG